MPDTVQTTGRRERILRNVGRTLLVTGTVLNVLALLPAIAASAWTGHWTASVVLVVLSGAVWAAGWLGLKARAARLRSRNSARPN
ncbi:MULTISPECIES: hypothetical protein [Paenarthrobacter]|uniref:Uncharacterized protein n=1 Tax=Paenarthrobacter ureafaciens TaxID=37931 RepID=A0AAX3EDR4_PAEUR|nr:MULTISPECIES: hypothetical protein [Paenarthrobacter]MDO5865177.1 hypothetical protein [Paenarthrobacter sp. SD-2]MDO5876254.1 hypothetical protein [Paenarthrobacter sp. SD-1]QMU82987.1 hypothetical protein FV140_13370 [Paenarthrobacter ureafaciens]UYV91525.1 hypothetical protein NL395_13290 [Paenarthrobacter ureafaciens]UYV96045.1 hypothetical protein NL394_13235 [Paenarthrobacter ureafaciens]